MADIKAEYLACPIRQVVSRFGDKWSMLVLYMLHTSETGVLRFNEIRRLMTDSGVFSDRDRQISDACTHCSNILGQGTFLRSGNRLTFGI